jgi:hypothetical protein
MRRLLEFLELPWDERVSRFHERAVGQHIPNPSYRQVTEPVHGRARGRWRNYRSQMEPVIGTLLSLITAFGYPDPRHDAAA